PCGHLRGQRLGRQRADVRRARPDAEARHVPRQLLRPTGLSLPVARVHPKPPPGNPDGGFGQLEGREGTGVLVHADGCTAIYDPYARELCRFCARRVGHTVAEDVVANTFLVAYERRDRFDPTRADTPAWLYGIAVNLLRRYRRDEVRWYRALARTGV